MKDHIHWHEGDDTNLLVLPPLCTRQKLESLESLCGSLYLRLDAV